MMGFSDWGGGCVETLLSNKLDSKQHGVIRGKKNICLAASNESFSHTFGHDAVQEACVLRVLYIIAVPFQQRPVRNRRSNIHLVPTGFVVFHLAKMAA